MNEYEILQFRHNSDGTWTPLKTVAIAGDNNHFEKGPTWGIVGGLEKVCLRSPRLSCLVPLACRSWPHTSGRADWGFLVRQPRWPPGNWQGHVWNTVLAIILWLVWFHGWEASMPRGREMRSATPS
jgi:hypothetical protein